MHAIPRRRLLLAAAAASLAAPARGRAEDAPRLAPALVAGGLEHPWSLAFLPDGRMLVSERPGRLRLVGADGRLSAPLAGLPPVDARAQGGLLDLALDPAFERSGLVYWSFAEAGRDGELGNGIAVARGRLAGERIADAQVVFRQQPKLAAVANYGGRLAFARDGRLFVTLGDRLFHRDHAQRLDSHAGKIVRLEADGRVPADNPFAKTPGARPEIWSLGHRNPQGAAIHPATGALWTHEHGPEGGDEVNVAGAGRNYGWPLVSRGVDYGSGRPLGDGRPHPETDAPLWSWVPSIGPSGLAFVDGARYPGWGGSLVLGALRAQALLRLELDGARVVREERLLEKAFGRVRDVRRAPDGRLWLLSDRADGQLVRLDLA